MTTVSSVLERALALYRLPLFELIDQAHQVHRQWHDPADIQRCMLLSIKTGGCPEDCAYCPQSAHYETGVSRGRLVRLSAGRLSLNREAQLMAFFAGANSIFIGERLLTTPNVSADDDRRLLAEVAG